MTIYKYTTQLNNLFLGRVISVIKDDSSEEFCVSLPTTSVSGPGEHPITPSFASLDALEKFCEVNWIKFLGADMELREHAFLGPLFWEAA